MNRRQFLRNSGGFAAIRAGLVTPGSSFGIEQAATSVDSTLKPWQPGNLDIHHINTGRGNATLVILPDATSILIDAGASSTTGPAMCAARPDESRRPGQWIARYIERQLKPNARTELDYAVLTHLHGDHIGDPVPASPASSFGDYKLTGISDVAEVMPIGILIDRGFPDYRYPGQVTDATGLNYIQFARSIAKRGTRVQQAQVGSARQIRQRNPEYSGAQASFPQATVRVIAGNGHIWTGEREAAVAQFPALTESSPVHQLSENSCSIALRLNYGKFSYFTGGDLTCDTNYGRDPWRDIESPAGKVAGPVSVSTCNHHGYFDATGPACVTAVQPRVWILQSWHASHPAMSSLANVYSPLLYSGPRDVFALGLHPAAALSCARFSDHFKSSQGHVLVRVAPGGSEYSILVLEDSSETNKVQSVFGPWKS